ncbi:MAG: metallophosphoesterase [Bryobacteraceae bacterium]
MYLRSVLFFFLSISSGYADSYFFIQMSDPQFGMYTGDKGFAQETANFEFAIATANRLKPAFVVITGDLVNKPGDAAQIAEYKRVAAKLDRSIPLYSLPGNHDVGNAPAAASLAAYREHIGRDYYSFRSNDLAGFVLDGSLIKAPENVPEEAVKQEQWLHEELEKAKRQGARHLVIFIHQSFFLEKPDEPDQYFNIPTETRRRFLALFHHYGVEHAYAGHYHRNDYGRDGSLEMVTTAPVGKPLGKEGSGFRIVRVREGVFESTYYNFGEMPVSAWDKPQALAAP